MSRDTVEKVVSRINECKSIEAIYTFGLGEALTHPDIYEIFLSLNKISRTSNTPVVLHTNGSCLTGEAAFAVLEIPYVTQLYISFDGYGDCESYNYLRGAHFHEVIDNVRNFMVMAKRKRPGLFVGTCSIYPDAEFLPDHPNVSRDEAETVLKSIFEPMGVHVSMRVLHKYNGFYVPELFKDKDLSMLPNEKVLGGCRYLEDHSFEVSYNGNVRPCRDVINEDFVIGNLYNMSFEDIIHDKRFISLRHEMRLDNRGAFAECAKCDKFSFGDDINAAANYWRNRIANGDITDKFELDYLNKIIDKEDKEK